MHICKQFIPHKDVIIYFKPGRRVANYFRTKDVTPLDLRSHIVYQYTCASCQASYVGQTSLHLRHRVAEHSGVSHLTDREVKNKVHSNIREHCHHCPGSGCSLQNFKVLPSGSSEQELLIKERLLIASLKLCLNGNTGSSDLLLY